MEARIDVSHQETPAFQLREEPCSRSCLRWPCCSSDPTSTFVRPRPAASAATLRPWRLSSGPRTSPHSRRLSARRAPTRSEEHTSELQSPCNLVCRLLLEKKKKAQQDRT